MGEEWENDDGDGLEDLEVDAIERIVYEANVVDEEGETVNSFRYTDLEFTDSAVMFLRAVRVEVNAAVPGGSPVPEVMTCPTEIYPIDDIGHIDSEPVDVLTIHPDDVDDGDFIDI